LFFKGIGHSEEYDRDNYLKAESSNGGKFSNYEYIRSNYEYIRSGCKKKTRKKIGACSYVAILDIY